MRDIGYDDPNQRMYGIECRNCGYSPTRQEMKNGTCPNCDVLEEWVWMATVGMSEPIPGFYVTPGFPVEVFACL